ncbi:hypothetical protein ES703_43791 [subsurface metagenome]
MPVALFPREVVGHIGVGTYTDIVALDAPSSAVAGSRVDVTVRIKNKYSASVLIMAVVIIDGIFFEWDTAYEYWVPAGATHSFLGHFTMPSRAITITARSYYYYGEGLYYLDDERTKSVSLGEVVGWQLLDTASVSVKSLAPPVIGWQLLDSRTLAVAFVPPVVGWQLLDSRTIAIKSAPPPVVGWQLLDEKTVGLTAGPPEEVPPEYELIQHTIYPWSYTFEGDAEICTFEFKLTPEQIPGTAWLRQRIVDSFASELEKEGSRLLELKVYEDTTPMFWTNYRVEVTATASPIVWTPIIIGVLAILFIIAIYFTIKLVDEVFFKRKALDEETKKTFSRETLTAMILDLAPETPPETLEGMEDQELRDLLNRLLAEVAPPISWWPLAIIGGVAVLGVGAVAFTMAKPEKG